MAPLQFDSTQVRKTQTFVAKGALNTAQKSEMMHDATCKTELRLGESKEPAKGQIDAVTDGTGLQQQVLAVI